MRTIDRSLIKEGTEELKALQKKVSHRRFFCSAYTDAYVSKIISPEAIKRDIKITSSVL